MTRTKPNTKGETMFSIITYRGFEITKSTQGDWTIIDEYGSGHVCDDLADCKATIDAWL